MNSTKGHAMIATGLTDDEKFLQCKNSNRNDPTKMDDKDVEIVKIPLSRSETVSEWSIYNRDKNGNLYIEAFFISIDLA